MGRKIGLAAMRAADVPRQLAEQKCPEFSDNPWTTLSKPTKVSIVSTAGLLHRGDRPFGIGGADYRVLDRESDADILMSHISTNFDRSGFAQDLNVVFPVDRLVELQSAGSIAEVARFHYSFMGATDPAQLEPAALQLADVMLAEAVNVALLVPV